MKIAIDAGHGGMDTGSIYGTRNEKDDNLELALMLGDKLRDAGFEVYQTRTEDVYDSPIERARLVNDSGADLLIALHRNVATTPNTYTGAEGFIHSAGGFKSRVAESILSNLEDVGFLNLGVNTMANDPILKRTQIPALLLEIGFINTDNDNELFDAELENIAAAITNAVTMEFNEISENYPRTYRVQVGGLGSEALAQKVAYRLFLDGYEPMIKQRNNLYTVWVGEVYSLDQATMLEQYLRMLGYNTFIIMQENQEGQNSQSEQENNATS